MALIPCKKCDYTFNDDEQYCPRCGALNRKYAATILSQDEQKGLTKAKRPGQIDLSVLEIEGLEELEELTRPDEPAREFADIAPPTENGADDISGDSEVLTESDENDKNSAAVDDPASEEIDIISFLNKTEKPAEPDVITEIPKPDEEPVEFDEPVEHYDSLEELLEFEGVEEELSLEEAPDIYEANDGYRFQDSDEGVLTVADAKPVQSRKSMVTAHQQESSRSPLKLILLIVLLIIMLCMGFLYFNGKLSLLFGESKPLTVTETINRMNPDLYLDSVETLVMETEKIVKSEPMDSPQQLGRFVTVFSECLEYMEPGFKLTLQPDQASRFQRLQDYLGGVQAEVFSQMRQTFAALFMNQPQMQQWRNQGVHLYCIGDNLDILRFVAPGVEGEPGTSQVLAQSMSGLAQLLRIKSVETSPDNLQILEWTDIDSFNDKDLVIWDKEAGTLRNITSGAVKKLAGISGAFTGAE